MKNIKGKLEYPSSSVSSFWSSSLFPVLPVNLCSNYVRNYHSVLKFHCKNRPRTARQQRSTKINTDQQISTKINKQSHVTTHNNQCEIHVVITSLSCLKNLLSYSYWILHIEHFTMKLIFLNSVYRFPYTSIGQLISYF